ncbi:MAG TPA: hypothetical protein VIG39_04175 [Rhizomicrobium sp.]
MWPLVLLWLAAHAVVLALILGIKFVTAKTLVLILMVGTAFWFLLGQKKPLSLPAPPRAGNDAHA